MKAFLKKQCINKHVTLLKFSTFSEELSSDKDQLITINTLDSGWNTIITTADNRWGKGHCYWKHSFIDMCCLSTTFSIQIQTYIPKAINNLKIQVRIFFFFPRSISVNWCIFPFLFSCFNMVFWKLYRIGTTESHDSQIN